MKTDIMVVGTCASGKTTLVEKLREKGLKAATCSQEHSGNPFLWQRKSPEFLVVLACSIETARSRRNREVSLDTYQAQLKRLEVARQNCQLFLETDNLTPEQSIKIILDAWEKQGEKGR